MSKQELTEDQKKQIQPIFFGLGLLAIGISIGGFLFIDDVADIIGMDNNEAKILCFSVFFIGCIEIILSQTIFRPKDRK